MTTTASLNQCTVLAVDASTCTAEYVSRHAGELLSEEGHVCLDDVHSVPHCDCGLNHISQEGKK